MLCAAANFPPSTMEQPVLDAILILGGIALFIVGVAYTYACERI